MSVYGIDCAAAGCTWKTTVPEKVALAAADGSLQFWRMDPSDGRVWETIPGVPYTWLCPKHGRSQDIEPDLQKIVDGWVGDVPQELYASRTEDGMELAREVWRLAQRKLGGV